MKHLLSARKILWGEFGSFGSEKLNKREFEMFSQLCYVEIFPKRSPIKASATFLLTKGK